MVVDNLKTETQLEEVLTEPSQALIDDLARQSGDLVILGAGGKMGPTLAVLARKAMTAAGRCTDAVYAVSRFGDPELRTRLERAGVEVVPFDLIASDDLSSLPEAQNVIFMVGAKFGATTNASWAWQTNAALPDRVARRYRDSRIAVLSTGNVYPFVSPQTGGCDESASLAPLGEYAQSCLGRERIFEFAATERGTPVSIIRLNYAVDLRYGVLADIGSAVWERVPISLATANVNVIWQGYANEVVLRSLRHAETRAFVVNLSGPELLSVRDIATRFGELMDREVTFVDDPEPTALLSDTRKCMALFGYPSVSAETLTQWQATWIMNDQPMSAKPTKWAVRDGNF